MSADQDETESVPGSIRDRTLSEEDLFRPTRENTAREICCSLPQWRKAKLSHANILFFVYNQVAERSAVAV